MNLLLQEFINEVPENSKKNYLEIAENAISFGYKIKKDKTKHLSISFSSNKYKATILRFTNDKNISLRLKFFAAKSYSEIFDISIKNIIEKYDYKYVGCYGCGKCEEGNKEGYMVNYDNGKSYFRCGFELIEIKEINDYSKDEIIKLMKYQTEYYEKKNRHPTTAST